MALASAPAPRATPTTLDPLRAWGALVRASLLPSAVADAAAGICLAYGALEQSRSAPAGAWWLLPASACLYAGGMLLNDWADHDQDAGEGRRRPLVVGAVRRGSALGAALLLFALGVAGAAFAHPAAGWWAGCIALLAAAYDLAWRGPLLGPLCLGVCRGANLSMPLVVAALTGARPTDAAWAAAGCYGAFIFWTSRLARLEDGEDASELGTRPLRALAGALIALVAMPAVLLFARQGAWPLGILALAVSAASALELARRARWSAGWTRAEVRAITGGLLRRTLIATGTLALACAHGWNQPAPYVALGIFCAYPLSWSLRRAFPPT